MEQHWAKIIEAIGEDLDRPGLADTPKRAAKAFEFLTRGYTQSVDEVVNNALFPSDSSEMILVQDVELLAGVTPGVRIGPWLGRGAVLVTVALLAWPILAGRLGRFGRRRAPEPAVDESPLVLAGQPGTP